MKKLSVLLILLLAFCLLNAVPDYIVAISTTPLKTSELQFDSLKTLSAFTGHIFQVESIAPDVSGISVYSYGSDYPSDSAQGSLNAQTVAVLHEYGAGKALTLSFPLSNMQESASQGLVNHVFGSLFNEPSSADDESLPGLTSLNLLPNYPNPFSHDTKISLEAKDKQSPLKISVYNLRGQLVRDIYQGLPGKDNSHTWDGKDKGGNLVGSGIYFLRAKPQ